MYQRAAAVLAGVLIMLWPAFYNGYPILYPDTMTYLDDGRIVAQAIFLHRLSGYYGMRSFIYSLGILPLHWNITPWPVIVINAVLAGWVMWLVARSVLPRRQVLSFLTLVLALSLLTSFGWYVSLVMPDILGPLTYLSIYLLLFARDSLSRSERNALMPLIGWGVASHITHLLIAIALLLVLALLSLLRVRWPGHFERSAVAHVAAVVALAAGVQVALNTYLYGQPSLNGERPPFLMARVIADGPGRWYLEQHCPNSHAALDWAICDDLARLPDNADDFLWTEGGIWQSADDNKQKALRRQEMPLLLATLRTYLRAQLTRSAANFWNQLWIFGIEDFDPSSWVRDQFNSVLPGQLGRYDRSRQARNALPLDRVTTIQNWTVLASVALIAALGPLGWRRSPRLRGLSLVVLFTVVVNAAVTGPLSMVDDRLESRVIWLVPLLAGVLIGWRIDRLPGRTPLGFEGAPVAKL